MQIYQGAYFSERATHGIVTTRTNCFSSSLRDDEKMLLEPGSNAGRSEMTRLTGYRDAVVYATCMGG